MNDKKKVNNSDNDGDEIEIGEEMFSAAEIKPLIQVISCDIIKSKDEELELEKLVTMGCSENIIRLIWKTIDEIQNTSEEVEEEI